jgi:2-phospho-L-lactate guanylyltransferase
MQATVKTFDTSTQAGTVLLDDGRELRFTASAFRVSGLPRLRAGQRVRLRTSGDPTPVIEALTISTLHLPDASG